MTPRFAAAIVLPDASHLDPEDRAMQSMLMRTAELDHVSDEDGLVHAWRTEQLRRLGLPRTLAEAFAGVVDWHEMADLVERGCAPDLALEIVR